jgi:hypothetical protein
LLPEKRAKLQLFSDFGRLASMSASSPTRSSLRANISETVLVPLINEQGEKEKGRDESACVSPFVNRYKH